VLVIVEADAEAHVAQLAVRLDVIRREVDYPLANDHVAAVDVVAVRPRAAIVENCAWLAVDAGGAGGGGGVDEADSAD
jgi:hypothetical protein